MTISHSLLALRAPCSAACHVGIGVETDNTDNWLVHNDNLNDILSMLNQEYASASTASTSTASTSTAVVETTTTTTTSATASTGEERQLSTYHKMYRKRVQNKDVANYSPADLAQILGLPPTSAKRKRGDADKADDDDNDAADARPMLGGASEPAEATTAHVTAAVSINDYFAEKMKRLMGGKPAAATAAPTRAKNAAVVDAADDAPRKKRRSDADDERKAAKKAEKKAAKLQQKKLAKKLAKKQSKKRS